MTTMTSDEISHAVRDALFEHVHAERIEEAITSATGNALRRLKRNGAAVSDDAFIEAALEDRSMRALMADRDLTRFIWARYLRAMLADGAAAIEADLAAGRRQCGAHSVELTFTLMG